MRNGSIVLGENTLNFVLPRLTKKSPISLYLYLYFIFYFLLYLTAVVAQKLVPLKFKLRKKKQIKINKAYHAHSFIPLPSYELIIVLSS